MKKFRSRCGFTLVELSLVLAIIGLVIGAIWLAYGALVRYSQNEIQEQQIADLLQMSRNYLAQFDDAVPHSPEIYDTTAYKAYDITGQLSGILPGSVKAMTGGIIPVQYGTANILTFPSLGDPYGYGPLVAITLSGFPQAACVDTLNSWGGSPDRINSSGMVSIVAKNAITDSGSISGANNLLEAAAGANQTSLQTADITGACSKATANVLNFIFLVHQ